MYVLFALLVALFGSWLQNAIIYYTNDSVMMVKLW